MRFNRLRNNRATAQLRERHAQTRLLVKDLIMPYFVIEGKNKSVPIKSMPGICHLTVDRLIADIKKIKSLGIGSVLLFGISDRKDEIGSDAYSETGIVQEAVRAIKSEIKDVIVITDVCICGYTSHGHCGTIKKLKIKNQKSKLRNNYYIENDKTIQILAKIALSHAAAGADVVAPSAMMDGQVVTIRTALDDNGFGDVGILGYSAKYASSFYGPFRDALDSVPQFGDRKTHQMDYRNSDEALREIQEDIYEGADMVMVKPALAYLDIIRRVREKFKIPIAAYNVSGEYSLIKAGAKEGLVSEKEIILEVLTSIKRAGADLIISYHAKEAAKWL